MTFVVTTKGFLKSKTLTVIDKKPVIELLWTEKLREAKQFKSRAKVNEFLKTNNLEGFAYNPKEQEPIRDKYTVVKRHDFYFDSHKHLIHEWIVDRAVSLYQTDSNFLNREIDLTQYYSKEVAEGICLERNENMLAELTKKIQDFKDRIAKDLKS